MSVRPRCENGGRADGGWRAGRRPADGLPGGRQTAVGGWRARPSTDGRRRAGQVDSESGGCSAGQTTAGSRPAGLPDCRTAGSQRFADGMPATVGRPDGHRRTACRTTAPPPWHYTTPTFDNPPAAQRAAAQQTAPQNVVTYDDRAALRGPEPRAADRSPGPADQRQVHRVGPVEVRPQLDIGTRAERRDVRQERAGVDQFRLRVLLEDVVHDGPGLGEVR